MNTSDYLLAAGTDGDVALTDAVGCHTYADLRRAVDVLAAELAALGLHPGARVALLGGNSFFWVAAYLSIMRAGHVAVPFPTGLTPADVDRNARQVRCEAVLVERRLQRAIGAALAGVPAVTEAALDDGATPGRLPAVGTDPHSDAVLLFTSGSTSAPKVVRVSHANIRANTESIVTALGLQRADRMLVVLPFFYCFGASLLHTHLRVGGSLALCNTFAFPETAIELLDRERCTGLAGVPSTYQLLLRASSFKHRTLPSLRQMQQAGGKLAPVLIEEVAAAQPQAELVVMYGQTEATARLSYLPPEHLADRLGSIGRGIPGVSLRVVGESGAEVAPGEVGEIRARGANISTGYLDDPEGTAAKFVDGELRTGDLATVDADGFIYVVDRQADFIKSWGYRISSQEIEAAAMRMPELVSAAVVGVPDDAAGEAVLLYCTARPGSTVTPEDVLTFCRRTLAKHLVPREVRLLEAMPLTANGKIAKPVLRAMSATPIPAQV